MATYEYHCVACGETFTRREHIAEHAEHAPACPKCGSKRVEQHYGSVFVKTARKS